MRYRVSIDYIICLYVYNYVLYYSPLATSGCQKNCLGKITGGLQQPPHFGGRGLMTNGLYVRHRHTLNLTLEL